MTPVIENTQIERQFGLIELARRLRTDHLSVYVPAVFDRNLIYARFLFLHSFLVNRPEYIEHVLLTNHRNYVKSLFVRRMLGPLLGNGLVTSEGEFWRRQRRIAAPAFHHKRIATLVDTMSTSTAALVARWQGRREPFDVAAEMMALTLDVITHTMFSANVAADTEHVRNLMRTFLEHARPSVLDLFGMPEWLPRRHPRSVTQAIAAFDALIARLLTARRAEEQERDDLLAMLLAARDPETGEGMTDVQLRDEILTIFLAGHETTANALSFTWYLLAQHPEAEAKLHAEVDRVLGGRMPGFADLADLKYTGMVFEEAMRLYPPVHTISRTAVGEDLIGGVRVLPGAIVSISPYVTHRNPHLWPDPQRFDPDRFLPEQVAQRHRFAYLPFGGGPRICIGNSFAMAEAQVIIASVAQRFRLRLAPDHVVQPIGLLTLRPKEGVWVTLDPR